MRVLEKIGGSWLLSLALIASVAGCGGESATKQPTELNPQDKQRMAYSMLNAGRVTEALRLIEEALVEEPENIRFHSAKGEICLRAGRIEEAERTFLRVLEIDPYMTDAHRALGSIYDQQGRKQEAEQEFKIAMADRAYPAPEKIYLNLGLLYSSQGRNEEAVDSLRTAVGINPKYYRGHFELASILDRLGNIEEAAGEYEVAAPDYDGDAEYHYRLGYAYYRLGAIDKARASLDRTIALAPGSNSAVRADELLKLID
jgi:type IV pilus assembly protein PilF